jgi:hypothetical protein
VAVGEVLSAGHREAPEGYQGIGHDFRDGVLAGLLLQVPKGTAGVSGDRRQQAKKVLVPLSGDSI